MRSGGATASRRFKRVCWLWTEGISREPGEETKVTAPRDNKHCLLEGTFKIFRLRPSHESLRPRESMCLPKVTQQVGTRPGKPFREGGKRNFAT